MTSAAIKGGSLVVDRITVKYGDFVAVEDISLKVEPGETTAVIGPSGCGKSTTLKAVAGLNHVSKGSVIINGKDITELTTAQRNIGLVPQSYACFPHMTVRGNISYGLKVRGVDARKRDQIVERVLGLTQLTEYADRKPAQLSGGQQQRVALGRAIAIDPSVLLLDEPLAALDPQLRNDLRRQLANIVADVGCGTLIVTHDQHEALALADKIAILRSGKLVQYGTPDELWMRPIDDFVANFLTNSTLLDCEVGDGFAYALNRTWQVPLSDLVIRSDDRPKPQMLIRPNTLQLADRADEDAFDAVVESVEYMGGRFQAVVKTVDGIALLVATDERLSNEDTVRLTVRPGEAALLGRI